MPVRVRRGGTATLLRAVAAAIVVAVVVRIGLAVGSYVYRAPLPLPVSPQAASCPDVASLAAREEPPRPRTGDSAAVAYLLDYACDTRRHLADLFAAVTDLASDDLDAGTRWVTYVQRTLASSLHPPLDAAGTPIYQPLWLLGHRAMDCSQVARLVVDGFSAAGIPARLLQLKGHVSAEFFARGRWRLAEADILGGGEFVRNASGDLASVDEILRDPSLLDRVRPYVELTSDAAYGRSAFAAIFERAVYAQSPLPTPYVIRKIERPAPRLRLLFWLNETIVDEARRAREHYNGWHQYDFCERSDPACTN